MSRVSKRSITVWVPEDVHKEFKRYCDIALIDMSTVLRNSILQMIKEAQEIELQEKNRVEQY